MNKEPVFILACSPRSGSTWLQRVITSTGEILMWGESGYLFPWGVLWSPDKSEQDHCLNDRDYEEIYLDRDIHTFHKKKADMWMAVLNPTFEDVFAGHKIALEEVYGKAAKREGFKRWGIKETVWGKSTLHFLFGMFPFCKVIFLTREFGSSFKSRFCGGVQNFTHEHDVRLWCEAWINQHKWALECIDKPNAVFAHYEDLCKNKGAIPDLLNWIGCTNTPDNSQCDRKIGSSYLEDKPVNILDEDMDLIAPYISKIDSLTRKVNNYEQ